MPLPSSFRGKAQTRNQGIPQRSNCNASATPSTSFPTPSQKSSTFVDSLETSSFTAGTPSSTSPSRVVTKFHANTNVGESQGGETRRNGLNDPLSVELQSDGEKNAGQLQNSRTIENQYLRINGLREGLLVVSTAILANDRSATEEKNGCVSSPHFESIKKEKKPFRDEKSRNRCDPSFTAVDTKSWEESDNPLDKEVNIEVCQTETPIKGNVTTKNNGIGNQAREGYTGDLVNGIRHGSGHMVYGDGSLYKGDQSNRAGNNKPKKSNR